MAVDYVKTGQPAQLTSDLKPLKWPHFMEKVGKKQHQIYTSKKVLGQLYDQVERVDFVPAFTAPFDTRILQAYTLDENILRSAREIKEEYDAHMRRIMAQQEIKTEFEVWSTFVLQHSSTSNPFKYHEQIGEISMALKDQFRLICHERAGGKDYKHIGPFAAAMYEVTAREITQAVKEHHRVQTLGGQSREMTSTNMPLMSYPWLFQDVLGKIAKSSASEASGTLSIRGEIDSEVTALLDGVKAPQPKWGRVDPRRLESDDYLKTSQGTTHPGEWLELFGKSNESGERKENTSSSSISIKSSKSSTDTSVERSFSANDRLIDHSSLSSSELLAQGPHEDCPYNAEAPVDVNPKYRISSVSHGRGSGSPLYTQGRTEIAGRAGKEQTAALNEAFLERVYGDDKALSVEADYTIPEGSNLRLLNDLMIDPSVLSDEPGNQLLNSSHSEGKYALEDMVAGEEKAGKTNQLSKANASGEEEKGKDNETTTTGEEKKNDANDKAGYSSSDSDSDVESDQVVLYIDTGAGLLDQLAAIAGDDSAPHPDGINDSPTVIQDLMDQKLDSSKSELMPASLTPELESRKRE